MTQHASIEQALDERHAAGQAIYARRDIDGYRELFSPTLSYRQANGKVIGRDELMRDVARQFRNLTNARSSFTREQLSVDGGNVVETLTQLATAQATAFGIVHRLMRIERRGMYSWTNVDGVWRIAAVRILNEKMTSSWRFGQPERSEP
jgi:hypothetical protein